MELKEARKNFSTDNLGRYFSALSNEARLAGIQHGWLALGINDNKEIIGTSITDKQLNEYKKEISSHTSPKASFIAHRIIRDNKNVILLEIPATREGEPMSWKGHCYARSGESLVPLDNFKRERLSKLSDWTAEIVEEASIEDLSEEAIDFARKEFKKKNPRISNDIDSWDNITFLNKAKLCRNGQVTRTAIILLGKEEAEHLINPTPVKITWILRDRDNSDIDYEHFTCPWLLQVSKVKAKIRNLKYRYIQSGGLFPEEVEQFDDYIIREALHNCIAHQDYTKGGRITLVERDNESLTFQNSGTFIPESIENVIINDAPENYYRNPFLVTAMQNLNMIDTIGSGIKKMFNIQKDKYFPLPDYDFERGKVKLTITGRVLNEDYAKILATAIGEKWDISLMDIIHLDKVAKGKPISPDIAQELRRKKLIEGRRPNYTISSIIAQVSNEEARYIKQKGLDESYYIELVLSYLKKFGATKGNKIRELLTDKLPDILSPQQKENKIVNLLQKLKRMGLIKLESSRCWILGDKAANK